MTLLASSGLFVLGFGGGLGRLRNPLGGGDLLPAYAAAHLWGEGSPFGNSSLGFPFGMELRYYPTADVAQNLLAGLVTAVSGNPFLGINAVFAISFPVTALAALWTLGVAGLRGPFAVGAALALTFVPYHWFRIDHVYLGTMYSAVLGVGLALLVGSGTVERRLRSRPGRRRFLATLVGVVLAVGTGGIYYACFTVLLCLVACGYRFLTGSRWRGGILALSPAMGVVVVLGACLAPAALFVMAHPALIPVADRPAVESVTFSGALAFALLPAPISKVPGAHGLNTVVQHAFTAGQQAPTSGVLWYADFGCLATVVAIAVLALGGCLLVRRTALARASSVTSSVAPAAPLTLGFVGLLLATTVLFFIPWGLNYLFAYFVTPQLRGWDRLIPILFTLIFVAAGLVLSRLGWRPARPVTVVLLGLALVVGVLDSVLPYRAVFSADVTNGVTYGQAGYAYAAALNAAVPGRCGVLELPYIGYPEEPPKVGMGNYEPLWPALTNPGKLWSFGAMKGTSSAAWQKTLGDDIDASEVADLRAGGFCAVHVDRRGYSAADADRVTAHLAQILGEPVASGLNGNWEAFAIPSPVREAVTADKLVREGNGVGIFYAPPVIEPGSGTPTAEVPDELHTGWVMPGAAGSWTVASQSDGLAFTSVVGELRSGACGERDVTVTLVTAGRTESHSLHLSENSQIRFSLNLGRPEREATLSVHTTGTTCALGGAGQVGTVALVDLRAAA